MRLTRVVAACVAIAAAGFAAGAWSSAPPTPTEKRLTKSVAALQAQVKALRSDVRVLTTGLTRVGKDVTQANTNADKANQGLGFRRHAGLLRDRARRRRLPGDVAGDRPAFGGNPRRRDRLRAAGRRGRHPQRRVDLPVDQGHAIAGSAPHDRALQHGAGSAPRIGDALPLPAQRKKGRRGGGPFT